MPTFKWTFRADDANASRAMRDFRKSVKDAETQTNVSSKKITDDLARMQKAARDAASANDKLGAVGGTGTSRVSNVARNVAEASLTAGVTPLTSIQGAVLSELGGAEALLAGINTKALLAAGGVAALGIGAGVAGTQLVQAFTAAADAVDGFQDVAGGTAEQASLFVNASKLVGVSTESMSSAIGKMLKSVNQNEEALNDYGATVVRTSDGSVDAIATFLSIAEAFASTEDPAKRAELASLAFGRGWTSINDVLERGGANLDELFEKAGKGPILSDEDLAKARELSQQWAELKQQFTGVAVEVGKALAPAAELILNIHGEVLKQFTQGIQGIVDGLQGVAAAASHLPFVGGKAGELRDALAGIDLTSQDTTDSVNKLGNATDDGTDAFKRNTSAAGLGAQALATYADMVARASGEWQGVVGDFRAGRDVGISYASSLEALDAFQVKASDSAGSLADATARSAEQIASAEGSVQDALEGVADAEAEYAKAVEDANRSVAEAQQAHAKAVEGANRSVADAQQAYVDAVVDGQRTIQDAEESAAERIIDAQERVADARRRAADSAVSSARRIEDAEQAVRDASIAALRDDNPYEASRRRAEAEQNLTRAKEDAASDQEDAARGVADAERDLVDTERQAAEDRARARVEAADRIAAAELRVADAQRQASDQIAAAQQRIVDAQRSAADQIASAQQRVQDAHDQVSDANARLGKAVADAEAAQVKAAAASAASVPSHQSLTKALDDTVDSAFLVALRMKEMGATDAEISAFLSGVGAKVDDFARRWGFSGDEVAEYNRQVALIQRQVNVSYVLHLDMAQFRSEMQKAAQLVAPGPNRDYLMAGIIEIVGGAQAIPQFAGGGVYRAPTAGGAGLAMLHDRETVFTPEQLATLGGGGTTIVVQGSIISERELASILARLDRQGFKRAA